MKLLLDENLPKRLKRDFSDHEVYTVREVGWAGKTNGELLRLMIESGFNVLITFDKNMQHQQNFAKYPMPVLVLSDQSNQYRHLVNSVSSIRDHFLSLAPGITVIDCHEKF